MCILSTSSKKKISINLECYGCMFLPGLLPCQARMLWDNAWWERGGGLGSLGPGGVEDGHLKSVTALPRNFCGQCWNSAGERPLGAAGLPGLRCSLSCVHSFPVTNAGWGLSVLAAARLKTSSPLLWQEVFEATAKTSASSSLATRGILRDRLRAWK